MGGCRRYTTLRYLLLIHELGRAARPTWPQFDAGASNSVPPTSSLIPLRAHYARTSILDPSRKAVVCNGCLASPLRNPQRLESNSSIRAAARMLLTVSQRIS